jgi:hypothetical protein
MKKFLTKYDYLLVGFVALLYFLLLFSRIHTFVFFSGDSSDWLASSIFWMVPQPYGSPLFITLGHLVNWLPFSNLVAKMTVAMDVIPSAITVSAVYLICKKFTQSIKISLVCALVLLGSAIFLTQATILDEFAISGMFVTLAFYFYIQGKKKLTILMLALGSAVQIIVIAISGIWFLLHFDELKKWWKTFWIYLVFGLAPYILILVLMYLPTPRLLSAHLSLAGIDNYLGATGTIASMSIIEAPTRILDFLAIFFASLGFALVPIFLSFKGITKYGKSMLIAVVTVLFIMWLYVTDSDPGTWHFLPIAFPLVMVFVAIGLQKMSNHKIVICGAVLLILANGVFLNANILAHANPLATTYENDLRSLPSGSYVISNSGGDYGLDDYFMMAEGVPIRPIFLDASIADIQEFTPTRQTEYEAYLENFLETDYNISVKNSVLQVTAMVKGETTALTSPRYMDYIKWMNTKYGLHGNDTVAQVEWILAQGQPVYVATPTITPYWQGVFQTVPYDSTLAKIIGVNTN